MGKEYNILLVDDDNYSKYILQHHLKRMGITRFTEANDGESALAKLNGEPFDLIIADRYMPGMEGIEFFSRLQANDALKNIPFLMITMESDGVKIQEASDAGVEHYLVKPIDAESFETIVKKLLGQ